MNGLESYNLTWADVLCKKEEGALAMMTELA